MRIGGFPTKHHLSLGMVGMHGTFADNMSIAESYLLVAIGVRFDDRVTGKLATFAPRAEIIHIDIDPSNIGKNKEPHFSLVADAKIALCAIAENLSARDGEEIESSHALRSGRWRRIEGWQGQK